MASADILKKLLGEIESRVGPNSDADTLRAAAHHLRDTLTREAFICECFSRWSESIRVEGRTWFNPPLKIGRSALSMRLLFWPPGFHNEAHRHEYWTITGIVENWLTFVRYEASQNGGHQGVQYARFIGYAGDAGFVLPGGLHRVLNNSRRTSASLHISTRAVPGPRPRAVARNRCTHHPAFALIDGPRLELNEALTCVVGCIDRFSSCDPCDVLDKIFGRGDSKTKLLCIKAIARRSTARAGRKLRELADSFGGSKAAELRSLARALAHS
jgi:predicted metal-dependent enzyme (double-stranded beta helix superfamily)